MSDRRVYVADFAAMRQTVPYNPHHNRADNYHNQDPTNIMRLPLLGLVSGLLCAGVAPGIPSAALLLGMAGLSLLLLLGSATARFFGAFSLGCLIGFGHGQSLLQRQLPQDCVGQLLQVSGAVLSIPERRITSYGDAWLRFTLSVSSIAPAHCAGPKKMLLSSYGDQQFLPGQRWTLPVRAKRPWGMVNPGSRNFQAWYVEQGIDALGSIARRGAVPAEFEASIGVDQWMTRLQLLRMSLSRRIEAVPLSGDTRQILRAVSVADKSGITRPLRDLFQQFGVSHLLVISGLHIGLAAAAGFFLGQLALFFCPIGPVLRFRWKAGIGLLVALGYAALAGFSVPAQRAVVMLGCLILAQCFSRPIPPLDRLLVAAGVVLLINPLAGVGVGFWLSFLAVGALLWLVQWRAGRSRLVLLATTHGYMALVMLPLGAFYFQGASMVSALSNLIMIPLIGFWVVPLALLAALAFCLGSDLDTWLWFLSGLPLEWTVRILQAVSSATNGEVLLHTSADRLAMLMGLLAVALLCVPGGWRHRLPAVLVMLLLCAPTRMVAHSTDAVTRIMVLDVGQGTAVVVSKGARVLVYDTGGGNPAGNNRATSVLLPYLRQLGVEYLDSLIISHADLDHSAGVTALMAAFPVQRVRYGPGDAIAGLSGGRTCQAGESWSWPDGPVFRVLSPAVEARPGRNNGSCVLQVQLGEYRFLLAGDVEVPREREMVSYWGGDLAAGWLLAPHHGSRTSSSWTLLKHVAPQIVVASSGYANRFNHPHPLVVERVTASGGVLLETAKEGAMEFWLEPGGQLQYRAWRHFVQPYWL